MRAPTLVITLDDDTSLVQQVQQGQVAAYGHLVSKYQDRVYNTCYRICGNAEAARDLSQDTFLKAMESIERFEGRSRFYTWLFRIAVNLSLSYRRKAKGTSAVSIHGDQGEWELDSQAAGLRGGQDDASDPSRRMVRREQQRAVRAAIDDLDPEHRAIIVLKDIESFDYAQIAEVLELPIGTVKSRLHRARMALKEKLKPWMADE